MGAETNELGDLIVGLGAVESAGLSGWKRHIGGRNHDLRGGRSRSRG